MKEAIKLVEKALEILKSEEKKETKETRTCK